MTGFDALALAAAATAPAQATANADVAWTDVVTAIALAVIALTVLGGVVFGLTLLRSFRGTLRAMDRTIAQLAPRTERILHHAERVAEDASEMSASLRADARRMQKTVESVDARVRAAVDEADARVRRFGEVLEIVQTEMEDTLLEATATARGLQRTAARLQRGVLSGRDDRRRRGGKDRRKDR